MFPVGQRRLDPRDKPVAVPDLGFEREPPLANLPNRILIAGGLDPLGAADVARPVDPVVPIPWQRATPLCGIIIDRRKRD